MAWGKAKLWSLNASAFCLLASAWTGSASAYDNSIGYKPLFESTDAPDDDDYVPYPYETERSRRKKRRASGIERPKFAVGLGLNIPDVLPLEGYVVFSRFFALRAFFVPTIPFDIRVEMPHDEISSKGAIVEHPALTIPFDAEYGPQYGIEAAFHPWGSSFYLSGGVSYRKLRVKGGVASPLIIRAERGGPELQTQSSFGVRADATTSQYVMRAAFGWRWEVGDSGYMNFTLLGLTKPYRAGSTINVTASVRNPAASDSEAIEKALADVKKAKEAEMEKQALKAMRPAEELILPIIGLTGGIEF